MTPPRHMAIRAIRLLAFAAAFLTACSGPRAVPRWQGETPDALLWVGNSLFYFNNSMHRHVGRLLDAAGVRGTRQTSVTINGAGLDWHDVGAYLRPDSGMARYRFAADNTLVFNEFVRPYDMVMMMDCSQ